MTLAGKVCFILFSPQNVDFLSYLSSDHSRPSLKWLLRKLHLKESIKSNTRNLVLFHKLTVQFMTSGLCVIDDTEWLCPWKNSRMLQTLSTLSIKDDKFTSNKDTINVVRCAIWYHLCNSKNVKNTHGGVLILVKLQAWSPQLY